MCTGGVNSIAKSLRSATAEQCRTHLVINVGVRSDVGSIDDLTVRHGHNDQLPDIGGAAPQTVVTLEDREGTHRK